MSLNLPSFKVELSSGAIAEIIAQHFSRAMVRPVRAEGRCKFEGYGDSQTVTLELVTDEPPVNDAPTPASFLVPTAAPAPRVEF